MIAELKFKFKDLPKNLRQIIKETFPSQIPLKKVLNDSPFSLGIFINENWVFHGFVMIPGVNKSQSKVCILFLLMASDLIIQIELLNSNNLFIHLKQLVNDYHRGIINSLMAKGIDVNDVERVVTISADGCSLVGEIENGNKKFLNQMKNEWIMLIIIPTITWLFLICFSNAEKDSAFLILISNAIGISIWYIITILQLTRNREFNYVILN